MTDDLNMSRLDLFRLVIAVGRDKNYQNWEARKALANILRSEEPLSRGDREHLAELVMGDWRRPRGRSQKPGMRPLEREVRKEHERRIAAGESISLDKLAEEMADGLGVDAEKLITFLRQSSRKK